MLLTFCGYFRVGRPFFTTGGWVRFRSTPTTSDGSPAFVRRLKVQPLSASASASPTATSISVAGGVPPLKVHLFVDGTWLFYSLVLGRGSRRGVSDPMQSKFGPRWQKTHQFAWSKLPQVVASQLSRQLTEQQASPRAVEVVRTSVYTSALANTPIQGPRVAMIEDWYRANFEVHLLTTPERPNNATRAQEKCVDIMIAVDMLYMACTNAFDVAVLVTGDKDFVPALQKTRLAAKRVALASVRNSCNKDLTRPDLRIRDFDVLWLEDHLDQLVFEKKTELLGEEMERRLHDLVTAACSQSSSNLTVTSRELGRYLQAQILPGEDGTAGTGQSALSLLKKAHGSIRSFLADYPQEFKISLIPTEYPDYQVQWRGETNSGVGSWDAKDEDLALVDKRIEYDTDVVGYEGVDDATEQESEETDVDSHSSLSSSLYENVSSDDKDEECTTNLFDFDDAKVTNNAAFTKDDEGELTEALGKLTNAQLKEQLEQLGGKAKSRDTKQALVTQIVTLTIQHSATQHKQKYAKHELLDEEKEQHQQKTSPITLATGVEHATGDAIIVNKMREFLSQHTDSEVSSRDLGRFLQAEGLLERVKTRYRSLSRFIAHCAEQGEPLCMTTMGRKEFNICLEKG